MTRRTIEPLRCDVCEGILIDGKCPTHPEAQLDPVDAVTLGYAYGYDDGIADGRGLPVPEPEFKGLTRQIALVWGRTHA